MAAFSTRCGFVAIVGRPNVGKSTMMNHLVGQKISITSRKAQTTRHRVTGIRTEGHIQTIFVDTPGFQTDHKSALNTALNQSVKNTLVATDCILFLLEALRLDIADRQVIALLPRHTPVLLVINKVDRVKDKHILQAFIKTAQAEFPFTGVAAVSARHAYRLDELLSQVRAFLPESPFLYPKDSITDKNEHFLATEIVREKLFRYLGEELPYDTNVEMEQCQLDGALRRIHITILVNKPNQKPMVIGQGGAKLKKIATEARLDMEKLFNGKVFLQLWVKVKFGWADDIRFLKAFDL